MASNGDPNSLAMRGSGNNNVSADSERMYGDQGQRKQSLGQKLQAFDTEAANDEAKCNLRIPGPERLTNLGLRFL
jgi:hypothetical protein